MQVDFFRLDESSLWYEVLVNPEACCMKWANEVDYAMPILTPQYLTEIHSGISNGMPTNIDSPGPGRIGGFYFHA